MNRGTILKFLQIRNQYVVRIGELLLCEKNEILILAGVLEDPGNRLTATCAGVLADPDNRLTATCAGGLADPGNRLSVLAG